MSDPFAIVAALAKDADDIASVADAVSKLAAWAIEHTVDHVNVEAEVARQHRGLEALTELLDQCATRDDLDILRSELRLRGLIGTPFDA